MAHLRPDVVQRNLDALVKAAHVRTWKWFTRQDVEALLQCRVRTSSGVIQAGIEAGFLRRTGEHVLLTKQGEQQAARLRAGQTPRDEKQALLTGPRFVLNSVADSRIGTDSRIGSADSRSADSRNRADSSLNPRIGTDSSPTTDSSFSRPLNDGCFRIGDLSVENVSGTDSKNEAEDADSETQILESAKLSGVLPKGVRTDTHMLTTDSKNTHKKDIKNILSGRACARSISNAKSVETKAAKLRAKASEVRAKLTSAPSEQTEQHARVYAMVKAYEDCMADRTPGKRTSYAVPRPGEKGYEGWMRAVQLADSLGADYGQFVKAQFFWMERWYGRRPVIPQLSTEGHHGAAERFKLYRKALATGDANPARAVVSRVREVPRASREVRFMHAERTLRQLMRNYGVSEEEILRVFAKGLQAAAYFDRDWLNENQTYMRLRNAGEV